MPLLPRDQAPDDPIYQALVAIHETLEKGLKEINEKLVSIDGELHNIKVALTTEKP